MKIIMDAFGTYEKSKNRKIRNQKEKLRLRRLNLVTLVHLLLATREHEKRACKQGGLCFEGATLIIIIKDLIL